MVGGPLPTLRPPMIPTPLEPPPPPPVNKLTVVAAVVSALLGMLVSLGFLRQPNPVCPPLNVEVVTPAARVGVPVKDAGAPRN